jgi:hypothetical protein
MSLYPVVQTPVGLQPVMYSMYASVSAVVRPGTSIRLYGFLVPNIFCIGADYPESVALESVAGFQP